jgi:hypothetical protein
MELPLLKCKVCGREWVPRTPSPRICPTCKSKSWNRPDPEIFPEGMKRCNKCKEIKPTTDFGPRAKNADGLQSVCRACKRQACAESKHRLGYCSPMNESPRCSQFLGICVAEKVIRHCGMFNIVTKTVNNTSGYDFVCGRGYKIDVKSACRTFVVRNGHELNPWWTFHIDHNEIADWFVIIAFDDREHLTPLHAWVIPGDKINHLICLTITDSERSLVKWRLYERPLDQIDSCCDALRSD